jgi:hypothetical protein
MEPVACVGRWKFLEGWTKVWSCEQHADELVGARRLRTSWASCRLTLDLVDGLGYERLE